MFEQRDVEAKIRELYPDIDKFGIFLAVKKEKLLGADNYDVTLEKDGRTASFKLGIDDVKQCMAGNRCSLINMELERFVKQFIDESYSVSGAG
ncbi:hypothetical protein SAMN02745206_02491 [Desulfacinum infernum DSM 9756]|uniref:Uncharacterized protein n=1 Tax=Desulfacinum infernum DSM 9756 TaxID=1121391 RepID=A0A1M5DQK3_9BACT|nr:hypothetical protein [Desulfacinum infernum]SHF69131.1 hypothetical protein SAMN02745206_02491 [Desulfacinum infernum DSM 9756]